MKIEFEDSEEGIFCVVYRTSKLLEYVLEIRKACDESP